MRLDHRLLRHPGQARGAKRGGRRVQRQPALMLDGERVTRGDLYAAVVLIADRMEWCCLDCIRRIAETIRLVDKKER